MKFACGQCGKKYVLSEDRVEGRPNVKIKCRVCSTLIVVKQDGKVVVELEDETVGVAPSEGGAPEPMPSAMPSIPATAPAVADSSASAPEGPPSSLQPVEVPAGDAGGGAPLPPPPIPPPPRPPGAPNIPPPPVAAAAPAPPGPPATPPSPPAPVPSSSLKDLDSALPPGLAKNKKALLIGAAIVLALIVVLIVANR